MASKLLRNLSSLTVTGSLALGAMGSLSSVAKADPFRLTYDSGIGQFILELDGTVQPDNNTVVIDSISSLFFEGDALTPPPLTFIASASAFVNQTNPLDPLGPGITSLDGTVQDFIACATAQCDTNQSIAIGELIPGFQGLVLFESLYTSALESATYEPNNFTLAAAPPAQSVPGPLPLFGAAVAFGTSRRLRSRLKATTRN